MDKKRILNSVERMRTRGPRWKEHVLLELWKLNQENDESRRPYRTRMGQYFKRPYPPPFPPPDDPHESQRFRIR